MLLLALDRAAFLSAVAGPDLALSGEVGLTDQGTGDFVEVLGRTPLLQGVGHRTLRELARGAVVNEVAAEAAIVVEGQVDERFYVLLGGRAAVMVGGSAGGSSYPGMASARSRPCTRSRARPRCSPKRSAGS